MELERTPPKGFGEWMGMTADLAETARATALAAREIAVAAADHATATGLGATSSEVHPA